jgi:hypothetical protein
MWSYHISHDRVIFRCDGKYTHEWQFSYFVMTRWQLMVWQQTDNSGNVDGYRKTWIAARDELIRRELIPVFTE